MGLLGRPQAVIEVARSKHPERVPFTETYAALEAKLKAQERRLQEQQKTHGKLEDVIRDLEERTARYKQTKEEYRVVFQVKTVRASTRERRGDGRGQSERDGTLRGGGGGGR